MKATIEEIKEIVEGLERDVNENICLGLPLDSASWNYEEGVILTVEQASKLVSYIKTLTPLKGSKTMKEKSDNELIAEFHDGTVFDENGLCTDPEIKYSWRPGVYDPLRVEHLQYHNSWNWLMPVVEKIFKMDVVVKKKDKAVYIKKALIYKLSIENVYVEVVTFIKWYHSQGANT